MPEHRPAMAIISWRVLSAMFIAETLRCRHFGSVVTQGQSPAFDEPADRHQSRPGW